ncbi:cyclic nucleotide-binding domain-containing protein [Cytophagaceae bacterium SJW1-29]|uniref:Cyclic nucleotide-binding domain-containing protein n=2 Tax=Salmonirosea aquatica TaxID=2654236 RepID=A0A7C9F4V2_9BACT|nr:cyclic nucleotide-binding domain-containing protein [Cytophagaceae bacterium SJW1-29]
MIEALKVHIQKFVDINEEDIVRISSYFKHHKIKKKQYLLVENQLCRSNYFVVRGCLRMFFTNEKGKENTIQFALENWWLADYTAFSTQKASSFAIQAIENSEVLSLDYVDHETMLEQFPQMERYFRIIHQRAHAASQFRIKYLYDLSSEEFYHQFNKLHPEFVQRIPQYLLASFLGFTPEYLSEIRKKAIS